MHVRRMLGGALSALVLLAVPALALTALGPPALLQAQDVPELTAEAVVSSTEVAAEEAVSLDSETLLNNWVYTSHDCGNQTPGNDKGNANKQDAPGHNKKSPKDCPPTSKKEKEKEKEKDK